MGRSPHIVITATRSYLFARENNAITQKAQLALNRLNREIIELSDVRNAGSTCMVYESPYGRRAVALVDGTVRLFADYASTTCPTTGGEYHRRGACVLHPLQPRTERHREPLERRAESGISLP
jgi:hypothetical protein